MGSLMVLYQIVKCFEYKNTSEREPLVQVWKIKFSKDLFFFNYRRSKFSILLKITF